MNRTCPACKARHVAPISNTLDLSEYKEVYKDRKFEAYACACGATWSAMIDREATKNG